ncbi:hypothetical protein PIB30_112572, partial [Stylosanthes scabra]|nr:hypothetical protein [Stylosanthes scabra]
MLRKYLLRLTPWLRLCVAAVTNRAVDQMNHNKNPNHNNQNIFEEEGEGGNGRPMTLATFLKVKPQEFKGTVNVTEADD